MTHSLNHFFYMGGYGFYVFTAYGSVIVTLLIFWFVAWRLWSNSKKHRHE